MPVEMNTGVLITADGTPCIVYDGDVAHVRKVEVGTDLRVTLISVDFRTRHESRLTLDYALADGMLAAFHKFGLVGVGRITADKQMEDLHMVPVSIEPQPWTKPLKLSEVKPLAALRSLLLIALFPPALWHTVTTRSSGDWRYLLGTVALVEVYALYVAGKTYQDAVLARRRIDPARALGGLIALSMMSAILGTIFYVMGAAAKDLLLVALSFAPVARTIYVIGFAAILFALRLRFRAIYGASEVYAGLYLAAQKLGHHAIDSSLLASNHDLGVTVLASGVYLVIRGLDNVHQGMPKDPLLKWLWGR